MNETYNQIVVNSVKTHEEAMEMVGRLFDAAQPGAVFAEPVTVGEHTVITASEVKVGMGYGFGAGGGDAPEEGGESEAEADSGGTGYGSGGGGGGASGGRPVAAIVIGPEGVRVEPIVDVTKLGLAFITALGAMFMMGNRMRQLSRKMEGS